MAGGGCGWGIWMGVTIFAAASGVSALAVSGGGCRKRRTKLPFDTTLSTGAHASEALLCAKLLPSCPRQHPYSSTRGADAAPGFCCRRCHTSNQSSLVMRHVTPTRQSPHRSNTNAQTQTRRRRSRSCVVAGGLKVVAPVLVLAVGPPPSSRPRYQIHRPSTTCATSTSSPTPDGSTPPSTTRRTASIFTQKTGRACKAGTRTLTHMLDTFSPVSSASSFWNAGWSPCASQLEL